MHVLFICTQNLHRSPTAEFMLSENPRYEVRSAGISMDSKTTVNEEMLDWADMIFVMDEQNAGEKTFLLKNFQMVKDLEEKIIVLDIPDKYLFGSEELVKLLLHKLGEYLDSV